MNFNIKNKNYLINEIQTICECNKNNDYCSTYQLKNMINESFKMWGE
jgi:hypothetical protein